MRVVESILLLSASWGLPSACGFVSFSPQRISYSLSTTNLLESATTSSGSAAERRDQDLELEVQKQKLLELLGASSTSNSLKPDPVLADPVTKDPLTIATSGVLLGGERRKLPYKITSSLSYTQYGGSTDTYINLLEPLNATGPAASSSSFWKQATPYIPPPLRSVLARATANNSYNDDMEYIPMRDLFTSPAVSFAYERGWRQGFAQAGFPGVDVEAQMAMDYFAPVVARSASSAVVVDMSCATGLFARRFAEAEIYPRVLACDYSDSMLMEARRRIASSPELLRARTQLDLVRLDVGQLPMQNDSVDALHAGAAMHCWPDLDAAVSEIYRVLKPGGRYFATTFLSTYFATLSRMDGQADSNIAPTQQAFQYFGSVDKLRELLIRGGFEEDKLVIEVLGAACVVIRAEK